MSTKIIFHLQLPEMDYNLNLREEELLEDKEINLILKDKILLQTEQVEE